MRYEFNVLDASGHSTKEFSSEDKAAAQAKFQELVARGNLAYANKGAGETVALRAFDDTVEETTFHRQLQGG